MYFCYLSLVLLFCACNFDNNSGSSEHSSDATDPSNTTYSPTNTQSRQNSSSHGTSHTSASSNTSSSTSTSQSSTSSNTSASTSTRSTTSGHSSASTAAHNYLQQAKDLIEARKTISNIRDFGWTNTQWTPAKDSLEEFAGADDAKLRVINMPNIRAHKPITKNTMGFYDNKLQAGAFANTYAATSDIHYRNQKSRYAELLWQAEKLERYANDPQYRNFANALAYLEQQAKAKGLSTIPFFTRGITSVNPGEWDKISIELMSKIHAARFKAEPDLFLSLIYTPYDSVLIEDTSINGANADKRWGNGPDGKGLNLLGLLYMTHRERFWKAFKDKFGTKFNIDKAEDVAFLLEWLTNYTG